MVPGPRLFPATPTWESLQNHSLVANPLCHALAVEKLKQRNCVFAGDAEQLFEGSDIELGRLCFLSCDLLSQRLERALVKDEIVSQLYQDAIAQQQGDNLLSACLIDAQRGEHIFK